LKKFLPGFLAAAVLQMTSAGYAATSPLQLNDLFSMARFAFQNGPSAGISPDGTNVFYVLENPSKQLWIKNLVDPSGYQAANDIQR
jgi:hypothetical protein